MLGSPRRPLILWSMGFGFRPMTHRTSVGCCFWHWPITSRLSLNRPSARLGERCRCARTGTLLLNWLCCAVGRLAIYSRLDLPSWSFRSATLAAISSRASPDSIPPGLERLKRQFIRLGMSRRNHERCSGAAELPCYPLVQDRAPMGTIPLRLYVCVPARGCDLINRIDRVEAHTHSIKMLRRTIERVRH